MSKLSLYDLVGDLVLYRNLDPVDARLPQFADAWAEIGLADATRPRKHEASYAQTTAWYLRRARALDRRAPSWPSWSTWATRRWPTATRSRACAR